MKQDYLNLLVRLTLSIIGACIMGVATVKITGYSEEVGFIILVITFFGLYLSLYMIEITKEMRE